MTQIESQLLSHALNQTQTLQLITNRMARIEARLMQLMLHQGMQSDGRSQIKPRETCDVV